ncbi:CapA family protein [Sutterella sp.]|uniref:CapA family protein n=1 Tax=Sutterella sp. TaxID=1981025 RepID=UPI003FD766B4
MKTSFIATGDSFITRHIPQAGYEGFADLCGLIARHDVRFANLETTFHRQEGYPAAASGGTWAYTDPTMLDDMLRCGFNLFNTANNHSGDFGQTGCAATIRHLNERGMLFAGTGMTLQEAARPVYLETPEARVAMIGITSTFDPAAAAGGHSGEMIGRPGLNPLRFKTIHHVTKEHFEMVHELARVTLVNWPIEHKISCGYAPPFPEGRMPFGKMMFELDQREFIETRPHPEDVARTVRDIKEARRQADVVLVSLHAHEMVGKSVETPAQFLETFAHACIDAGADVVIGHGPHLVRGIERYKDGLIFYSLGNFIFETETVALQPYDAFKDFGLSVDTQVGAYMDNRSRCNTIGFPVMPEIWRAVAAGWTIEGGRIKDVVLHPLDLGMDLPRGRRGVPRLTKNEAVLEDIVRLSNPYGTQIKIENGVGRIVLD